MWCDKDTTFWKINTSFFVIPTKNIIFAFVYHLCMKHIAIIFILLCLVACKHSNPYNDTTIKLVEVKSFPLEKISVRAIVLLEKNVAFAGSDATFGFINTQNQTIATSNLKNRGVISDFRAVAATSQNFFMLSIGNPALLYKAEQSGMEEVYHEEHPDVFYDVLRFTDDQFGIAIGGPYQQSPIGSNNAQWRTTMDETHAVTIT